MLTSQCCLLIRPQKPAGAGASWKDTSVFCRKTVARGMNGTFLVCLPGFSLAIKSFSTEMYLKVTNIFSLLCKGIMNKLEVVAMHEHRGALNPIPQSF